MVISCTNRMELRRLGGILVGTIIKPLLLAFVIVLVGTPFVKKIACKFKAFDEPDARKVHLKAMPRLGGLAICLGFWCSMLLTQEMTRGLYGLLVGGFLITFVGIIDDIKGVTPRMKLFVQVIAACVVISAGVKVEFVTHPFEGVVFLGYISYPLTLLWIIGVTNAINLIDGLDGLAAGVSAIAAITLGVVTFMETSQQVAMIAFILAASAMGFLKYNFYPAKIFMGDTGSLFLGFNLAAISILGFAKSATVVSIFLPIVILGIPILDTLFAIVRRFLGKKPIFGADKGHLHHRLLGLGLSHKDTVLAIYGISIFLGFSAVIMARLTTAQGMLIMVIVILGFFIGADKLGILKKDNVREQRKEGKTFS